MSVVDVTNHPTARKKRLPQEIFRTKWREAAGDPHSTLVNPYPGLRSFNVSEAHIFRARNNQIKAIRNAFAGGSPTNEARHVTMVVGGSSSGKSSIVKAGLLADIHSLHMPDSGGNWYVAECRPVQAPMQELLAGLASMIVNSISTELQGDGVSLKEEWEQALAATGAVELASPVPTDDIRANATRRVRTLLDARLWSTRHQLKPDAVAPALALFVRETLNRLDLHLHPLRAGPPRLLVSIDQFEEIFRCEDNAEKAALFDLVRFIDQAKVQGAHELYLVASMRSEELHRCSELKGIADIVNRSLHLVELVSREDVTKAIIEPARITLQGCGFPLNRDVNWPYTQEPVDDMAASYDAFASGKVDHRADALPLLQHLLRLLWEQSVSKWVEDEAGDPPLLLTNESLSALPGWDEIRPRSSSKARTSGEDIGEAQNRLARVLNFRADSIYQRSIDAWCRAAGDSSDHTRALAQTILKAAFVSLVRQDDRRRVVREWQTLDGMLATSKAVECVDDDARQIDRAAVFEKPLAAALREFENATLIERRADARSQDELKLPDKYTVYHESFIRNWRQYANWVREAGKASATLQAIYRELSDPATVVAAEEIVSASREADLNAVVGDIDYVIRSRQSRKGAVDGWASKSWMSTEILRVEIPGARFDVKSFLTELNELRSRAISARKKHLELEAETAKAKARTAEAEALVAQTLKQKAEKNWRATRRWLIVALFLLAISIISFVGMYIAYRMNKFNEFQYRISTIGRIGWEATEVEALRTSNRDRDLWLVLNALEEDVSSVNGEEIQETMRAKIAHRARQVAADLTFVPNGTDFFGGYLAQGEAVTCLQTSSESEDTRRGQQEIEISAPNMQLAPSTISYRIEGNTLQYKVDGSDFRPVGNIPPLEAPSAVCMSRDASALLVLSRNSSQLWPLIVFTHWNKVKRGAQWQWYLQTELPRYGKSYSTGALLAEYLIDTTAIDSIRYFHQNLFVGFLVQNGRRGTPSKQIGVLWTDGGFSSAVPEPASRLESSPISPRCEVRGLNSQKCTITKEIPSGYTIVGEYKTFSGIQKACIESAELCQVKVKLRKGEKEIGEFSYQGRPPKNFDLDTDYLYIVGDDDIVTKYDMKPGTPKDLISRRWRHLSCKLDEDVRGELARNSTALSEFPKLYEQKGLPPFFDGMECRVK